MPVDYVGTRWENGTTGQDGCVSGFTYVHIDFPIRSWSSQLSRNLGFVPATSATLFNQLLIQLESSGDVSSTVASAIQDAVQKVLASVSSDNNDIAP